MRKNKKLTKKNFKPELIGTDSKVSSEFKANSASPKILTQNNDSEKQTDLNNVVIVYDIRNSEQSDKVNIEIVDQVKEKDKRWQTKQNPCLSPQEIRKKNRDLLSEVSEEKNSGVEDLNKRASLPASWLREAHAKYKVWAHQIFRGTGHL